MKIFTTVFLVCITCTTGICQTRIDHQYFQQILLAGDYQRVYHEAQQLRDKVYGKCAFLDYYIGKSLCLSNQIPKSQEWFQYILKNYPLKDDTRGFITGEMANCSRVNLLSLSATGPDLRPTPPLPMASVSGVSKSGPTYDCNNRGQLINYKNMVSDKELESRIFGIDELSQAVAKIKSVVGDGYRVIGRANYIVVTPLVKDFDEADANSVVEKMDKATHFFKEYYNLRAPDKLLTIYLAPNADLLAAVGKQVHGLGIPWGTIYGYSILGDLSVLGISTPQTMGTIYHELFHLIVRTDAGDMPAWLDEGMASLYSTARWDGDQLIGADSWRLKQLSDKYLRKTSENVPSLSELVNYNWLEFNGGGGPNLCSAAINYALANHFLLYAQKQGKLRELVSAYRKRADPGDAGSPVAPTAEQLIEKAMGMKMSRLEDNFREWLNDELRRQGYIGAVKTPAATDTKDLANFSYSQIERGAEMIFEELRISKLKKEKSLYRKYYPRFQKIKNENTTKQTKTVDVMQQSLPDSDPKTKAELIKMMQKIQKKMPKHYMNELH